MTEIWLISDTHLFHRNMLTFKKEDGHPLRPFSTIKDLHDLIYTNWNERVKPNHHLYHLGDIGLQCSSTELAAFIKRLNGKKRLVRGNHDRFTTGQYVRMGFEEIHGMRNLERVWLTHPPMHQSSLNLKKYHGNAHGHIHANASPSGPYLNLSVEATGYKPIHLDEVIMRLKQKKAAYLLELQLLATQQEQAQVVGHDGWVSGDSEWQEDAAPLESAPEAQT